MTDSLTDGLSTHVEASFLGLPPGTWPTSLEYKGKEYRRLTFNRNHEGDLVYVLYKGPRRFLYVFND